MSKRELVLLLKKFFICGTIVATGAGKYLFPHWKVDFIGKLTKKQ